MRGNLRQKAKLRRKNFFPTLIATFLLWALVVLLVYFVEPQTSGAILLFFLLVFLAFFFTLAVIFGSTRRGVIIASGMIVFLVLRYFGVGNILNFILISGTALTFDIYFSKRNH